MGESSPPDCTPAAETIPGRPAGSGAEAHGFSNPDQPCSRTSRFTNSRSHGRASLSRGWGLLAGPPGQGLTPQFLPAASALLAPPLLLRRLVLAQHEPQTRLGAEELLRPGQFDRLLRS